MSELKRRATNRDNVLNHLKWHKRVKNVDLIAIGGLRAMGRVHELQKTHHITVEHERGPIWIVTYKGEKAEQQQGLF